MSLPYFLEDPKRGLEMLASDNYLVVDLETTNLEKGSCLNPGNSIVCTGMLHPKQDRAGVYWGNEYQLGEILKVIESAGFIVGQNLKFDLGWLRRAGLDLSKILIWDTMLGEYALQGNKGKPLSWYGLDTVLARYGLVGKDSVVSKMMKMGVCPSRMPKSWLEEYAAIDVEQTHKLFLKQREIIINEGLLPVMFTRCLYTPVLTDMEARGMHVDADRVIAAHREVSREHQKIMAQLDELTGGINPKSGKQVAEYLYDTLGFDELRGRGGEPLRSPKGGRKTDSDTIGALKATTTEQKKFLDLKKEQARLDAALSKTLNPLLRCVEETDDHILYANFRQNITKTHRLSSTGKKYGVQFQNFPRKYKYLFSSRREESKIGESDYSMLEFGVAGFAGQDEQIYEDVRTKFDVHSYSASFKYKVPFEEIVANKDKSKKYSEMRTGGKEITFKPLFGGTSGTKEEKQYFAEFKQKYSGLAEAQEEWVEEALTYKKSTLMTGLKVYWPYVRKSSSGYIEGNTKVRNYRIQYLATGEIAPIANIYLWHRMKDKSMKSFIISAVHDSSLTEVAEGEEEEYTATVKQAYVPDTIRYLKEVYGIYFDMPLTADVSIKTHWASD